MKIVTGTEVLAPSGGIEVCIYEDCIALADRGHAVQVLYTRDGTQRPTLEEHGVTLRGAERFLFDPRHPVQDIASFVRSGREVRRRGVDVLWLNRPENIVWAQIVSRIARVPLVVHLHHAPNYRLEKQLVTGVDRFIAVSDYMKGVWTAVGIPGDRIEVVSNAVPAQKYPVATPADRAAARAQLGVPDDVRVVLFFGRVTRDKGILSILQAWEHLAFDPSRALLVVAGDGSPGDEPGDSGSPQSGSRDHQGIASAFDALPAGSVLRLPAREDVTPLLHAADLVVVPSWVPEAFGRTVVEALLSGVPAIGSDRGGIADILTGDLGRFLVPPHDAQALAERIRELLDWRDTEPDLGAKAREIVAARFSYDQHVDGVEEVLQSVVNG